MSQSLSSADLAERVANASWYQSLPLPGGVVTPGSFDTLDELSRVPFPVSLKGQRCLDVATANGFWAFEMERRGAAEVIAIDLPAERLDWPGSSRPGPQAAAARWARSFEIAHEALDSKIQWRELSVYDLAPETLGHFDFVFMGSLLLHLRDPVAALSAVGSVLRGELLSVDAISPPLTALHPMQPMARFEAPGWPLWWVMNLSAYRQLFGAAELEILACGRPFFVKRGPTYFAEPSNRSQLYQHLHRLAATRLGNLHAWVSSTPANQGNHAPAAPESQAPLSRN